MNLIDRVRLVGIAAVVGSMALAASAAGVRADSGVPEAPASALGMGAPAAPRSPVAKPGNKSVKLTWLAPGSNGGAPIDKYVVLRSTGTAAGPWTTIAFPTTPGYTATGLSNGTTYHFLIRAHNRAGYGPSTPAVAAVPRTKPSAPRSPLGKPGNESVTLTSLAPSTNGGAAIDRYQVYRSTNGTTWTKIATPTGVGHTASGLANGTKYEFRVRAHNSAGYGPYSTVINTVPRTVPTAPRSPLATPGNAGVKLSWLAPTSNGGRAIDKYEVYQSTNGTTWTKIATPTGVSYTASGLINGTAYSFRNRPTTLRATGRSAPSSPQCRERSRARPSRRRRQRATRRSS